MFSPSVLLTLFVAGMLTILLPCILPLVPIVLGVSVAGHHRLRPLVTVAGMVVSFVAFTFLLQAALSQFISVADLIRISTLYVLLLFGVCFMTHYRPAQMVVAILGSLFYWDYGLVAMVIGAVGGVIAVELGGRVAAHIQQWGSDVQQAARGRLGGESLITAFIVGLTLGLVWVPCAGPALGFALTLVRDEPGAKALLALFAYGTGAAVPLLLIGYGGQYAVSSVRSLSRWTGVIKQAAGAILILTALGLRYGWLMDVQTFLIDRTGFGTLGTTIEESLFNDSSSNTAPESGRADDAMTLPKLVRAPEFKGLGPWHNSLPFTLKELKGKVVLVDFWTYSCINCIRTLPHMRGYWEKFKDKPFVLLGVHTPEFVFEKDEKNVANAIEQYSLEYPIAQDNDFGTWNAFANRYWPAKYLIDAEGVIRYTHFGEGNYEETDMAIRSLLEEAGQTIGDMPLEKDEEREGEGDHRERSPETYLGSRSWPAFFNSLGDPDDAVHTYKAPDTLPLNRYALVGRWQLVDGERQTLKSETGEIRYKALGTEVNAVLGLDEGVKKVNVDVIIDGKYLKTLTIDRHDSYNLFVGAYGQHDVLLKVKDAGLEAYSFTFGS